MVPLTFLKVRGSGVSETGAGTVGALIGYKGYEYGVEKRVILTRD